MLKQSDEELIKELSSRLKAKDRAYEALMVVTRKIEALNDKLVESEKVKSQFLSNIRNEINNPLTSVLSMCELFLFGEGGDPAELQAAIKTIHNEAFVLNFQLRNIFMAAELEAGEASISPAEVNIVKFVDSVVESFRHSCAKGCDILTAFDGALKEKPMFTTDAEKLERILSNLVSNAVEFSPAGSRVDVSAAMRKGGLSVTVSDRGPGIDACDTPLIFERFRQLQTGSTKAHAGQGLGLTITKALVELLNGILDVKSEKGSGTVISFSVPAMVSAKADPFSAEGNDFFFNEGAGSERF